MHSTNVPAYPLARSSEIERRRAPSSDRSEGTPLSSSLGFFFYSVTKRTAWFIDGGDLLNSWNDLTACCLSFAFCIIRQFKKVLILYILIIAICLSAKMESLRQICPPPPNQIRTNQIRRILAYLGRIGPAKVCALSSSRNLGVA